MQAIRRINPLARAVAVIGAVVALVASATFAALTSTATLTGNTLGTASANADLLLWNGSEFASTAPGFSFSGLIPGQKSEKFDFYFKNAGNTDLNLTARVDAAPEFSEGLTAADITLKFYGNCHEPIMTTLEALLAGPVALPCDPLEAGAQGVAGAWHNDGNYSVKVKIADTVEMGEESLTVGPFDIIFDGTAVGSEEPEEPETPEVPEVPEAPIPEAPVME